MTQAMDILGSLLKPPQPAAPPELSFASARAAFACESIGSLVREALYFTAFLGCLVAILLQFPWRAAAAHRPWTLMSIPCALASLASTWRLILIFFIAHEFRYAHHDDPPNLFVDAYALVCDDPRGWWWSGTLLLWVAVACPMMHAEAVRHGMPMRLLLAHVVVAFCGAVSLATPIFFAHLLLLPPPIPKRGRAASSASAREGAEVELWSTCTCASVISTVLLPLTVHTHRAVFIAALAVVHTVLALPAGWASVHEARWMRGTRPMAALPPVAFAKLAYVAAVLHVAALAAAAKAAIEHGATDPFGVLSSLIGATVRNECQASISIDAVLTSATGMVYMLCADSRSGHARRSCLLALAVGPAASLGFWYADHATANGVVASRKAEVRSQSDSGRTAAGKRTSSPKRRWCNAEGLRGPDVDPCPAPRRVRGQAWRCGARECEMFQRAAPR